jgi:hypothetical protein
VEAASKGESAPIIEVFGFTLALFILLLCFQDGCIHSKIWWMVEYGKIVLGF